VEPDRLIKSPGSASRVGAIADRQGGSSGMIRPCIRAGISCWRHTFANKPDQLTVAIGRTSDAAPSGNSLPPRSVCARGVAGLFMRPPEVCIRDPRPSRVRWPQCAALVRKGCGIAARQSASFLLGITAVGANRNARHWIVPAIHAPSLLRDSPAGGGSWSISRRRPIPALTGAIFGAMQSVRTCLNAECPRTNELRAFGQRQLRQYAKLMPTHEELDADCHLMSRSVQPCPRRCVPDRFTADQV
jgi:hypothetical protein